MSGLVLVIFLLFLHIGALNAQSQTLKTVRMMTPTIGVNVLVYEAANRFGFYRQEGFTIELIRAPLGTSVQAVLGGSADYVRQWLGYRCYFGEAYLSRLWRLIPTGPHTTSSGSAELANVQDLSGRTVAIAVSPGSAYWATRETLSKNGINPDKVNFQRLGGPELRLQALLAGVVDAAPLNFVLSGRVEKDFKVLAYTGDFVSDVQLMVAAPTDKIKRSSEEVYKFIKATVKARKFQFENQPEAYKFYLESSG